MKVWCAFRCGFGLGGLGFAVVVPVWGLVFCFRDGFYLRAGDTTWTYFPIFMGQMCQMSAFSICQQTPVIGKTQLLPLVKAMRWGYFGGAPGTVDRAVESVPWRSEVVPSGQNWEFQPRTCWWCNKGDALLTLNIDPGKPAAEVSQT